MVLTYVGEASPGDRVRFVQRTGIHGQTEGRLIGEVGTIRGITDSLFYVTWDTPDIEVDFGPHVFYPRSLELINPVVEDPLSDEEVRQVWY